MICYSGVGIREFAGKLKKDLVTRIDLFVKELEERHSKDSMWVRSNSEWIEEYKQWSEHKKGVRELAEKYILGDF